MPTQAFFQLDEAKRRQLLEAAVKEFASLPYDKVSIFKIARNAAVSRTGLYYYFRDKEDIYRYLVTELYRPFVERLQHDDALRDPFTLSRELFLFLATYKGTEREGLLRQVLRNAKSVSIGTVVEHLHKAEGKPQCAAFARMLGTSSLRVQSFEEVLGLTALLQTIAHGTLLRYLEDEIDLEQALAVVDRFFDLLRYGFCNKPASIPE